MFSYRHVFHAGNHADVLKHAVLVHVVRYLTQKPVALHVVDTHAGAGWYRLDSAYAQKSGEAEQGVAKLWRGESNAESPSLISDYLDLIREFNPGGALTVYPGSPWIVQRLLRPPDRLHLFELHPTDRKLLAENIAQLSAGRQVTVYAADGFEGLKGRLPPVSRRGLVLIDPSYEIKTDYARVAATVADGLKRFATGTYAVWYPILATRESQMLPDQLRRLARAAGRDALNVSLTVRAADPAQRQLVASGVFLINPPFTLGPALEQAMPELVRRLGQDERAGFALASSA